MCLCIYFVYILILNEKRIVIRNLVVVKAEANGSDQYKYISAGMSGFSWRES